MTHNPNIAFVIGCQRSGTTLLSDLLGMHPDLATWNEPYFIWDWHLPAKDTDARTAEEATPQVKKFCDSAFTTFQKKYKCKMVIEKSPENCFRIPFVHALYPDAKFIHILRDGRDVAQSIVREWNTRAAQVKSKSVAKALKLAHQKWYEQPDIPTRLKQFYFEFRSMPLWPPSNLFNKARWKGYPGWGPRFDSWQRDIEKLSQVEFNALQWVKATEQALQDSVLIPSANYLEIRYEDLTAQPNETLQKILSFLGIDTAPAAQLTHGVRPDNSRKWEKFFTKDELLQVEAIQGTLLQQLGYKQEKSNAA